MAEVCEKARVAVTPGEKFVISLLPELHPSFHLVLGDSELHDIRPDLNVAQIHGIPFVKALTGKGTRPNPYLRTPFYLPTFDPDEALRDKKMRGQLRDDLTLFKQIMATSDHLDLWPTRCVKCSGEGWKQPVDLLPYCASHAPPLGRKIPVPQRLRDAQVTFA